MEAAQYYYENYDKIEDVVAQLEHDSLAINTAKSLFRKHTLKNEITFISNHFLFLAPIITQLEFQNVPLTENVANVEKVVEKLKRIQGDERANIKSKLDDVSNKNKGWMTIYTIAYILRSQIVVASRSKI